MSAVGSILTNQGALDALQSISTTSTENNTLENEMSTGLSISSPADNPAGYITAQGFTSQLNGMTQAISNANQGVSLLQTAQGAVQQQIGVVQQLNSIAVQAANGTQTSQESSSLQSVVEPADWPGLHHRRPDPVQQRQPAQRHVLQQVQFQVGANEGQTMNLSLANTSATSIGMYATGAKSSVYTGTGSGSGAVSASTTGVFTAGAVTITGPTGGSGDVHRCGNRVRRECGDGGQ